MLRLCIWRSDTLSLPLRRIGDGASVNAAPVAGRLVIGHQKRRFLMTGDTRHDQMLNMSIEQENHRQPAVVFLY